MQLEVLAATSTRVAATSKRTEKLQLLAACISDASEVDRGLVALYLAGSIRQAKLGVGYAQVGAMRESSAAAEPSLNVLHVDATLETLAAVRGSGSAARRQQLLSELFGSATAAEQQFLVRLLLGELRQGALESLVLDAVARAAAVPAELVRRAQMLISDLDEVTRLAFESGEPGLAAVGLVMFRPIQPMLADSAETAAEALARIGRAELEYKLDGARVQVHKSGDEVRIYTRTLNDVTHALPETVAVVRGLPMRELILDGEVIALREDGKPWPFQETMRRFGRSSDAPELRAELPLSSFFFDCLYVDGRTLLDEPLEERLRVLGESVPEQHRVPRIVSDDASVAQAFMERALADGHEGLMAKACGASYAAGRRGSNWIKLKRAHSLDLVVLAAEWGSGRRSGWLSNLHLGARDPAGGFVMLGKTFKGMTDALLRWQTEALLALEVKRDRMTVYVRPELVVEVAYNDLQRSSHYPGGVALRFARVKGYRLDKVAGEADTIDTVLGLFARGGGG